VKSNKRDTPVTGNLEEREEDWEEERRSEEHDEQEDLNQGSAPGTHDSTKHGVKWGASYRERKAKGDGSARPGERGVEKE